ncbi:MAG: invasion associated locus B family protein [Cypionkella sp.]|nr:invasion associated locus B family protein [Cypionkella sp.]MDO8327720.1 invasion associated locus B family protein [Cypionkella sp.]
MTELPRTFALSFGLALALAAAPVLAQETTTEAPATEATAADAPVADGLNMGTEAGEPAAPLTQETAEVGQTYTLAAFELWEQRCTKMADGSDPCQLYQLLKDKDGNNVAEISMFPLPAGGQAAAGATIIAPLETLLTANLLLAIDGTKPKIYPFTFCAQIGCIARVGFTAEEVNQFKKGAKATMTIIPAAAPDQKVDLDVSLKGFTAGYDAVATTLPK